MTTYGILIISVAVPLLVAFLGRPGWWASVGLVVTFLVARLVANFVSNRSVARAYDSGRCTRCGYDTRTNVERCPECGDDLVSQASRHWRRRFGF